MWQNFLEKKMIKLFIHHCVSWKTSNSTIVIMVSASLARPNFLLSFQFLFKVEYPYIPLNHRYGSNITLKVFGKGMLHFWACLV